MLQPKLNYNIYIYKTISGLVNYDGGTLTIS